MKVNTASETKIICAYSAAFTSSSDLILNGAMATVSKMEDKIVAT